MIQTLIKGGVGLIGSNLYETLFNQGHEFLSVVNFFKGCSQNIVHLFDNKNFKLLRHDIAFPLDMEVDEIYNLACPASLVHCQFNPEQTMNASVMGAINMPGLAKKLRVNILQSSIRKVFGDPTVYPQYETYWGNQPNRAACLL